jgi:O-antigen/teichoic acid export membrane protein
MNDTDDPGTSGDSISSDAAKIAGGSAIVLVGGIGERSIRLTTTWFLSGALGTTGFGIYTFATTVASILSAISPVGTNTGITMFGARFLGQGEQGKLKGALSGAFAVSLVTGPLFALSLYLAVQQGWLFSDRQAEALALKIGALAVLFATPLAVAVGALIAAKDMRGQALGFQIALPGFTLLGCIFAVAMGAGFTGAMMAFAVAHGLALLIVVTRAWRLFGPLLTDKAIAAKHSLKEMLAYSLPASFAHLLYRSNLWIDILMLTWLTSAAQVGVYKVAVAMAMLGALPVMASTTMFGPVVAELVYAGEIQKLNGLLKVVTRWLIIIAAPLYLVVLLLPDLILSAFDPAYATGVEALSILMVGQVIYLACAPAGTTLVMSGHSMLNMVNGIIAVAVNLTLNSILIPRYGILGAATASSIAISLWPLMRLFEVRWLLGCWPFTIRTGLIGGSAIIGGLLVHEWTLHLGLLGRCASTAGLIVVWASVVWLIGRTPEDQVVFDVVRAKIAKLRA